MSVLQRRLYRFMKSHNILLQEDDGEMTSSKRETGHRAMQNRIMQLRKICNHPYLFQAVESSMIKYVGANPVDLWRTSGKFELLGRIIPKFQAAGHRMLIFCQMTNLMTILEDYFIGRGIKYLRLDGSTKPEDRGELLKVFNAPGSEYDVFMLSTRAGGLGLNLQTADTVIIFDSDWNPHQDLQAQDRAHRIGQKNEVRVFRLCTTNSVEEHILAAAKFKLNMDAQVIQAGMFNHQADTKTQREYLAQILENEDTNDDDDDVLRDGDHLNELIARDEDEFEFFQQMDEELAQADSEWMDAFRRSRLMQAHELPLWALRDDDDIIPLLEEPEVAEVPQEPTLTTSTGRSSRARKAVSYAETLSERQWLKAVEDGTLEEQEERESKRRKAELEEELTDHDAVAAAAELKAAEEAEAKRVKEKRATIPAQLLLEIDLLANAVATSTNHDGSFVSKPLKLPDKEEHPQYYKRVSNPISVADIKKKADSGDYTTMSALEKDVQQLVANAGKGWGHDSPAHVAAKTLMGLFHQVRDTIDRLAADGRPLKKRRIEIVDDEPMESEDDYEIHNVVENYAIEGDHSS